MWPEDLRAIFTSLRDLNQEFGFVNGAKAYIFCEVIDLGNEAISK
jgi:alpha-amylase